MTAHEPSSYINRELSQLEFQSRVLALAENKATPLLERVKFVAIVSQNLDEFYQVRVAGLLEHHVTGVGRRPADGMSPREQLDAIHEAGKGLIGRIDRLVNDELFPALEHEGIHLTDYSDLSDEDRAYLSTTFDEEIYPVLTPLAVDPSHPFPFISNLSLNLAVELERPKTSDTEFARVKVPGILARFIRIRDEERFVPLEQVIGAHLHQLFSGSKIVDHFFFRVTRNADIAVEEEEAKDLLEAMESVLRFRQRSATAVRLEIDGRMSDSILNLLATELGVSSANVFRRTTPLDLGGLWDIYNLSRPELKDDPWTPTTQPRIADHGDRPTDFFAEISKGDILVHHPYESFATSTGAFLAQAAQDPNVLAIKQTLYRTSIPVDPALGGEEAIVRSLIAAAEAGKQVVVLVELKARFDEAANISWAKLLESAGVHVVYGVPGLKTHTKTLLVIRREREGLKRYAHIGTGNYNPNTARLYEDLGLFTADPDIGADLSELFNALTGFAAAPQYRKLLVAPHHLREEITRRIRQQANRGVDGRILMKLNHLIDPDIIDELYAASAAGCRVELIVRGVCGVRAGVPGLSQNITLRSIVGRFLEHSRIIRFGTVGDGAEYYLGSADMMQRNLNARVEVLAPITDPSLQDRVDGIIDTLLTDDTLAWQQTNGEWQPVPHMGGIGTHASLMEAALERTRGADSR
ncbi:MAG: polyphosphate kinase 1 [Actinobacteria bacterium]|nr:polyphosphate kinase 1 [Actinomycetota bacterium]